jgi:hypothetical protein
MHDRTALCRCFWHACWDDVRLAQNASVAIAILLL